MKLSLPVIMHLPWRDDAAKDWFHAISDCPWAMLLHSSYFNHPYSRFDILVADPFGTLITWGNITKVSLNEIFISKEDPLILLNRILKNCNIYAENNPDLPFQGGALGLFGYDLVRCFEKLPTYALHDINLPDMAIGLYDWALIVDHYKKQVLLLSHSNIKNRFFWLKLQKKRACRNFRLTTSWHTNMSSKEYEKKFDRIQNYLQKGDCYQVNLSQRFSSFYEGDEWQAFIRLHEKNCMPFCAFLRLEKGAILSFSPERFIQLSSNKIQTRPIKGTLPRLTLQEEDKKQIQKLENSLKNRAENLMIVDLMRNDIGRVAVPGTVKVPELFSVETFPSVHHMVSTITAYLLPAYNACDLLRATFPGGSITGAPKIRAMEIIDELEPYRRNAWCGSIGYLSVCGRMDTNIAIRTIIAWNGKMYCSAGGGIIADSQFQDEYQETLDKINCILNQLEN